MHIDNLVICILTHFFQVKIFTGLSGAHQDREDLMIWSLNQGSMQC